jgi:alkylation response protein AidB-like acyl-CoA dehydrogenase
MATTTAVPSTKISGGSFLLETRRPDEIFTPEDFTEQHQLIGQTAEEFAVNEILPNVEKIEHKDFSVTRDLLRKAGELGLSSVEIPEAYGGLEMDKVTAAVIADHIAKYAGFATTWGGHTGIGTLPIVYFGTEEQKKKYLPRLASGEIVGAYALSESTSGSDAMNSRTRAELSADGKHYILNGEKMWITNAGFADLFTVFAKIDGEKFSAFLVERTFPGFSVGAEEHKMGIRGSSTCPIILNDCKVPVENLLGEIGKGHVIAFNILNIGRFKLGAMCVGGGRLSLVNAVSYAKQRKAFNKVIADFGLVREKIANMATLLYVGESLVYRTVGMMDVALGEVDKTGADAGKEVRKAIEEYAVECSILKVWGSEMIDYIVDETLQIYAGYGFVEEYPAERAYRDARINRIFEGTNEINRLLATGMLLKRAQRGQLPLVEAVKKLQNEILSGPVAASLVENAKKTALFTLGIAYQKYGAALDDQQEVLASVTDIAMNAFVMESVELRARKLAQLHRDEIAADISAVFLREAMEIVESAARNVLAACSEGDALRTNSGVLKRFTKFEPVNAIAARRRIAERLLAAGRYLV